MVSNIFLFSPVFLGNDPNWRSYFSYRLKTPTSIAIPINLSKVEEQPHPTLTARGSAFPKFDALNSGWWIDLWWICIVSSDWQTIVKFYLQMFGKFAIILVVHKFCWKGSSMGGTNHAALHLSPRWAIGFDTNWLEQLFWDIAVFFWWEISPQFSKLDLSWFFLGNSWTPSTIFSQSGVFGCCCCLWTVLL